MGWDGFQNRNTSILYQMITGQEDKSNIPRLLYSKDIGKTLRNIYYDIINSPTPNALQERVRKFGEKPIAYKQIIKKLHDNYEINFNNLLH